MKHLKHSVWFSSWAYWSVLKCCAITVGSTASWQQHGSYYLCTGMIQEQFKWTALIEEESVIVGSCAQLMWQTLLMFPVKCCSFHKNSCWVECRKLEKWGCMGQPTPGIMHDMTIIKDPSSVSHKWDKVIVLLDCKSQVLAIKSSVKSQVKSQSRNDKCQIGGQLVPSQDPSHTYELCS